MEHLLHRAVRAGQYADLPTTVTQIVANAYLSRVTARLVQRLQPLTVAAGLLPGARVSSRGSPTERPGNPAKSTRPF